MVNVTLVAPLPKSRVPTLLRQAGLVLHCLKPLGVLRHGVSPDKLYDCLASAKAILVSTGAAKHIVRDAGAGLSVLPGSPEALAEGVLGLYRLSPEERRLRGWAPTAGPTWRSTTTSACWASAWPR